MENQENTVKEETVQPKLIKRNDLGLIEGLEYKFLDEGRRVDWLAMIPREYFVVNKANFEKRNQPVPTSIEGLENKDILLLLEGFRYVMELRGFINLEIPLMHSTETRTTSVVKITWLPNFETEFQTKVFSAEGDATLESTRGFGFLGPVSENRAFCRCVRNFLHLPVLGRDELDNNAKDTESSSSSNDKPTHELEKLMKQKKVSWELIKTKLCQENVPGADTFTDVASLPKNVMFNLIERLQKKKVGK